MPPFNALLLVYIFVLCPSPSVIKLNQYSTDCHFSCSTLAPPQKVLHSFPPTGHTYRRTESSVLLDECLLILSRLSNLGGSEKPSRFAVVEIYRMVSSTNVTSMLAQCVLLKDQSRVRWTILAFILNYEESVRSSNGLISTS